MRKRFATTLIVTTIVVVGALGVATAETFRIRASSDNRWRPKHTYIGKGDRVVWRNPTSRSHNIRAYGGNWSYSRSLPAGETRAKRFRQTGTFRFRCSLHSTLSAGRCSGMCGIVHVFS